MIKTLSPYYVTTPLVTPLGDTCDKYTLQIFVWTGSRIDDVPSTVTYSITINNAAESTGDSSINISRLINDYIDFEPTDIESGTVLNTSDNQIWVRTQVRYIIDGVQANGAFHLDTQIAVKGYGYGLSGENPDTPDNQIMMRVGDYTMGESSLFIVPIELDEIPAPTPEIVITNIVGGTFPNDADVTFTSVGAYSLYYIYAEFVSSGVTSYVSVSGTTSPQTVTLPSTGEWDITMYGYDGRSNSNVVSNTYNVTI